VKSNKIIYIYLLNNLNTQQKQTNNITRDCDLMEIHKTLAKTHAKNYTEIIDYLGITVFLILIIFWCDLDIQGMLTRARITTNIRLGLFICGLITLGILVHKYISQTLAILLFVIILLITKAMLGYTELFTTTPPATEPSITTTTTTNTTSSMTTNPNIAPISEFSGNVDEVQQFLLRQIADDPNTTTIDKRVMEDLTVKYFKSSSKLAELRGFNIASESANILPGQQLIVGLDTVKNQH